MSPDSPMKRPTQDATKAGRMPATEIDIPTHRGRFVARVAGAAGGPLVLLLHGFPDDASTFDALAADLAAEGYRAVAPYFRGYAPSALDPVPGEDLFATLGRDAAAIAETLAPGLPVRLVGHDNGAFAAYAAVAVLGDRARAAVTLAAGHPAAVFANTKWSPKQWCRSRYAMYFQLPGLSVRGAAANDFAYLERLWRRWSPGWEPPDGHLARVKATLRASWPAPLKHYRIMPFGGDQKPLQTPTLFVRGAADGCVGPAIARGQERYFAGGFREEALAGVGHFPHLERPAEVSRLVRDWLAAHP